MTFPYRFNKKSLAGAGFKRLELARADGSFDPITGTKLVDWSEVGGSAGSTTVTLKNGMNSTNERLPSNMVRWWWDMSKVVNWDQDASVEFLIEFVTPTTSANDVNHWLGLGSGTTQSVLGSNSYFGGVVHSVVFITVMRPGRFRNGNVGLSNSGTSAGRHMYINITKGKDNISDAALAKSLDSDYNLDTKLGDFATWTPGSTTDPVYFLFSAGTNANVALGSGSNVSTNFRLWYRVNSLSP